MMLGAHVSRFGVRLVSGRTSVRYRFGSPGPFSSKRLWFVDTVLTLTLSIKFLLKH